MAKDDDQQTLIIVLAMGAAALFLSRYLSSSESSAAQEYVDALDQFTIKHDDSRFKIQWPEKNFVLSERDMTSK